MEKKHDLIFCPQCGVKLDGDEIICSVCGYKLAESVSETKQTDTPAPIQNNIPPPIIPQKPPINQNRPAVQPSQPPYNQNQPPVQPNQPTYNQNRPPVQPNQPPYNQNQPPVNQNRPPVQPNQPPYNQNRPPIQQNQPPINQNRPPVQPNQPPYNQNRPPVPPNNNYNKPPQYNNIPQKKGMGAGLLITIILGIILILGIGTITVLQYTGVVNINALENIIPSKNAKNNSPPAVNKINYYLIHSFAIVNNKWNAIVSEVVISRKPFNSKEGAKNEYKKAIMKKYPKDYNYFSKFIICDSYNNLPDAQKARSALLKSYDKKKYIIRTARFGY